MAEKEEAGPYCYSSFISQVAQDSMLDAERCTEEEGIVRLHPGTTTGLEKAYALSDLSHDRVFSS
jgi:hypothetical protein